MELVDGQAEADGDAHMLSGEFEKAAVQYTRCLEHAASTPQGEPKPVLLGKRATAWLKLGKVFALPIQCMLLCCGRVIKSAVGLAGHHH